MKPIVLLITLALFCQSIVFAQQWEFVVELTDTNSPFLQETVLLDNGDIAVPYWFGHPDANPESHFGQPGILLLSADGEELVRKTYVKPAFWAYPPRLLWDEEGETYMMLEYSPDHDTTSANYFLNFDNPPDYSILGLYKLDDSFDIIESYEHQIPIDTFMNPGSTAGPQASNSLYCGSIYVFTTLVDENTIVGGYLKKPTADYDHPRGHDSLFFFRMGFDGTMIERKGYDIDYGAYGVGGIIEWGYANMSSTHLFKTDEGFAFYTTYSYPTSFGVKYEIGMPGHAYFLDNEFNLIELKEFNQRPGLEWQGYQNPTFVASHHNSMYLSTCFVPNGSHGCTGCALYEYDLGSGKTSELPILRYIERMSSNRFDYTALRQGACIDADDNVYFAYALRSGENGMTIEHLHPDFDTIATLRYDLRPNGQVCSHTIHSINVDKDGDVLLTFNSIEIGIGGRRWSSLVKFSDKTFMDVGENHEDGLQKALAYPNPGKTVLNIETDLKNAYLEVYDVNGKLVHSQYAKEGVATINTESWPAGTYLWKMYVDTSSSSTGFETLAKRGKWVKE